jgi:hypothetical protein
MKSGIGTIHLVTQAPGTRRRAIYRKGTREVAEDAAENPDEIVRFYDGVLEQYMNRPDGSVQKSTGSIFSHNFEDILYADYHRGFQRVSGKELKTKKKHCDDGSYYLNHSQHESTPGTIDDECFYTIERNSRIPVSWDWLLPHSHGLLYYYQRLLLATPFRSARPTDFISAGNQDGSLPAECELRGIIKDGSVAEQVQEDATNRLFGPEAVTGMMDNINEYNAIMEVMAGADVATHEASILELENGCGLSEATRALIAKDVAALQASAATAAGTLPAAPIISVMGSEAGGETWTWQRPDPANLGSFLPVVLKPGQVRAYKALRHAGEVQIKAFLSGEGVCAVLS